MPTIGVGDAFEVIENIRQSAARPRSLAALRDMSWRYCLTRRPRILEPHDILVPIQSVDVEPLLGQGTGMYLDTGNESASTRFIAPRRRAPRRSDVARA